MSSWLIASGKVVVVVVVVMAAAVVQAPGVTLRTLADIIRTSNVYTLVIYGWNFNMYNSSALRVVWLLAVIIISTVTQMSPFKCNSLTEK